MASSSVEGIDILPPGLKREKPEKGRENTELQR